MADSIKSMTPAQKKDLRKKSWSFLWRSWAIQASWNYERQMNMGFLWGIAPTLNKLYSKPEDLEKKKAAYQRHMAFYHRLVRLSLVCQRQWKSSTQRILHPLILNRSTLLSHL